MLNSAYNLGIINAFPLCAKRTARMQWGHVSLPGSAKTSQQDETRNGVSEGRM